MAGKYEPLIAYFKNKQNPGDSELLEALKQLQRMVQTHHLNVGSAGEQQTYLIELRKRK